MNQALADEFASSAFADLVAASLGGDLAFALSAAATFQSVPAPLVLVAQCADLPGVNATSSVFFLEPCSPSPPRPRPPTPPPPRGPTPRP